MTDLVPRSDRGLDQLLSTRRDRRQLAEIRTQAQLAEFWEYAEAQRLDTRMRCGRHLVDRAAVEYVDIHHRMTDYAAGDAAMELDLRDFQRVFKRGCEYTINDYLNRR